jgi:hypothetical protein
MGGPELSCLQKAIESLADKQGLGAQKVEEIWGAVINEYRAWEKSIHGAHTSTTNRKLYFFGLLQKALPGLPFESDARIVEIVLSDLNKPGHWITAKLPDNTNGRAKIIRREITKSLSVLFTFESKEGFLFTREFVD